MLKCGYTLYGSAFRIKAISEIEAETKQGVLKKRVGKISDDSIGYRLDNLTIRSVRKLWNSFSKISKRNGMFRNNMFDDYVVGIFDGIETYKSYNCDCERCLTRLIQTKDGEKTQYYHRAVVLTIAGFDFQIPIGLEMMKKGEDEVNCALRLLKRIVNDLGTRFLDIVIGDALYCRPNFFDECEKLNIIPGAVLKNNQENLLETAKAMKETIEPNKRNNTAKEKTNLWDLKNIYWYTADKEVRVIWADRKVLEKSKNNNTKEEWVDKKRVFVFSNKIDHIRLKTVYEIGIHRWDIDAKMFLDIVKHWHLKHKTLHFERAYENLLNLFHICFLCFSYTGILIQEEKTKLSAIFKWQEFYIEMLVLN